MDLRWQPIDRHTPNILCLMLGTDELARVQCRVDGSGWVSYVRRHVQDQRGRLYVVAPSQRTALKWAERWTRANIERIRAEIPKLHTTHCGTRSLNAPGPPPR